MSSAIRYTDISTNREEDVPAGGMTFSTMGYVPAQYTDISTNREEDVPAGGMTFSAMGYVPAQYTDVAQREYAPGADREDLASLIAGDMDVATHWSMPQWSQVGGSQTSDFTATMGIPGHSQWSTTSIIPGLASNTRYGDLPASSDGLVQTGKGKQRSTKPKKEGNQFQAHHRTGMTNEKRMMEYMWRPVTEMLDRIDYQLENGFVADQDDNPEWLNQPVSNEQA
ncbi:hypothetical protein BDZ89DRAFT_1156821 [Hymenopellis radicata]|nr:hypothetical protein BDZ89DRAFT_1156821 [Hymenopellis radicata]